MTPEIRKMAEEVIAQTVVEHRSFPWWFRSGKKLARYVLSLEEQPARPALDEVKKLAEELLALAGKATPGERTIKETGDAKRQIIRVPRTEFKVLVDSDVCDYEQAIRDTRFFAACSPDAITKLAREVLGQETWRGIESAPKDGWKPTHRHVNSGKLYRLINATALEVTNAVGVPSVIYEASDGRLYVQDGTRFFDGRFEHIKPLPAPPVKEG